MLESDPEATLKPISGNTYNYKELVYSHLIFNYKAQALENISKKH